MDTLTPTHAYTTVGRIPAADAEAEMVRRERARRDMLPFMRYCWRGGDRLPLFIGRHTDGMCRALADGVRALARGVSSFWDIRCPIRHGKSDASSRYFPAWLMGQLWHLDPDVIMAACTEDLAISFSRDTQDIMATDAYKTLFPGVRISSKRSAAQEWGLAGRRGTYRAVGMSGGSTPGRGGSLIIVDDWCPSREDAENQAFRDKVWRFFTNDIMSRRAPAAMVCVVATPWHVDGLQGRIDAAMERDKDFPKFQTRHFRAREKSKTKDGEWDYLFAERMTVQWYKEQYATMTPYEAAGLLDCDPTTAAGNLASRDSFRRVAAWAANGKRVRYWDTAATKKKTSDYTCGVLGGMNGAVFGIQDIYKQRVAAAEVGEAMLNVARQDGFDVEVWIECEKGSMGLIGPAALAKPIIAAGYTVRLAKRPMGSKLCVWMPLFGEARRLRELGGMAVVEGPNVEEFLKAVDAAPDTPHDDDLDAAAGSYRACNGLIESESATGGMRMQVE